jgi:DNA primase
VTALDFNAADHPPLEPIDSIKGRTDIVAIVGRYVELKKRKRDYWAKCPLHTDGTPSFKVNPEHQAFMCFGCGAKGDVFDFIRLVENLDLSAAIERVLELVGGGAADPATAVARAARRAAAAAQEAQDAARRTADARQILAESEPLTMRTGGLPVQYLVERRGITQWQPYTLRWHPYCPWEGSRVGCIVVPVENAAGDVTAVWRIRPVMAGKVQRLGLGPVKGCFAPVIDHADIEDGVLTIAEGVEDALSAWVLTTYPAWAALSAGNMKVLELPQRFRRIIICADAEPIGLDAARTLAWRLRAEGREARIIQPTAGKDANDVLRARAA